ncbi:MAG: MFS transporter, partial [Bacteroidales bacterium]|nr:MFS transporter [Bacteroidales bacterium]
MKKYLTVVASFVIMLCIGGIYSWSIIASALMEDYQLSAIQSQIIFGVLIAILPVTMIFVAKIGSKINKKYIGYVSGILFLLGYLLAGASHGNFLLLFTGIGILSGVGTGFGYWLALTTPVMWFPGKKGLITGIAAAGFGLGAVLMSEFSEIILRQGYNVLELLKIIGISYGIVILAFSNLIYTVQNDPTK